MPTMSKQAFTVYEFPEGHHGKFYSQREVDAELATMRASNADLLEALKGFRKACMTKKFGQALASEEDNALFEAWVKAGEAIAKAEGK